MLPVKKRPYSIDIAILISIFSVVYVEVTTAGGTYIPFILALILLAINREFYRIMSSDFERRATLLLIILFFIDLLLLTRGFFYSLTHFLLGINLYLCFKTPDRKNLYLLHLLSTFNMVIAASVAYDLWFALAFIAFVFFSILAHIQFRWSSDSRLVQEKVKPVINSLTFTIILLILTMIGFISMPRGRAEYITRTGSSFGFTGFAYEIRLGQISRIYTLSDIVMRVESPRPLLWRGQALDYFDGTKWTNSSKNRTLYEKEGDIIILENDFDPSNPELVVQKFSLLGERNRYIFGAYRAVALEINLPSLYKDDNGVLISRYPFSSDIEYTVYTILPELDEQKLRNTSTDFSTCPNIDKYLQLPKEYPRIKNLALSLTANAPTIYDKFKAIETYLQQNYKYTLDLSRLWGKSVEEFLFEVKAGHCEYFASAMAVMLRSIGIPCRVVTGFRPGIYNQIGGYYIIQQRHSHAWVEAYIPGVGWELSSPTPIIQERANILQLALIYFDQARHGWHKFVINFGKGTQQLLLYWFKNILSELRNSLYSLAVKIKSFLFLNKFMLFTLAGLLLVLAARIVFNKWISYQILSIINRFTLLQNKFGKGYAGVFYREIIKFFKKQGIKPEISDTPMDLALKALKNGFVWAGKARELIELYYLLRYGAESPPMQLLIQWQESLKSLKSSAKNR